MISRNQQRPLAIDLFAGAGGLSLGFEQAGFDVAAAVEIDPVHCAVHQYNFPDTKIICESVAALSGERIRELAQLGSREIDVVCGGAPCQGFSTIGKRALDDPRNQLVFHFCRLVDELRPRYAVFENVRGLTFGLHKKFLNEIVTALQGFGYEVLLPYKVLNAADYGVPQDRKRLFLIAARKGECMPDYPRASGQATVSEAILDLPNADDFPELLERDWIEARLEPLSPYARRLNGIERDPRDFSHPRAWDAGIITSSLRTEHTQVSKSRFSSTEQGKVEPISRFLKLNPEGLCNTLRAGTDSARGAFTSPRPIHPIFPRVITVREAARLHSYPDWFRFHCTKWHGFRQIGNSVPPLLGRAVASAIIAAIGAEPMVPYGQLRLGSPELLRLDMGRAARLYSVARSVIAQRVRSTAERSTERTAALRDPLQISAL
jgi:DNA (cytosine-5)-methyltransferase 1